MFTTIEVLIIPIDSWDPDPSEICKKDNVLLQDSIYSFPAVQLLVKKIPTIFNENFVVSEAYEKVTCPNVHRN